MIDESKVATSSVEHKPTPTKLAEPRGAAQKGNYSTVHKTKRQQLLETKLSKLLKAADKIKRELANKWGESSCTKTPKKNKKNKKK